VHSSHPKEDAQILVSTMRRIEYEALLQDPNNLDTTAMRQLVERQVSLILKIDVTKQ
jgi:hypothetical protein